MNTDTNTPPFTAEQYADRLIALVRADLALEPDRYGAARSWQDLHDVCDANEYFLDAEASFGYDFPPADSPEWEPYIAVVNAAMKIAERELFDID